YNQKEFFAVISEYFFERPHLLKRKEPVVYEHLVQIFKQDPTMIIGNQTSSLSIEIGRNAPCPCGSGRKFKRCCI
ncbi:MAG: zinc-dependent peptidase, partial [Marinoscillum sp.]